MTMLNVIDMASWQDGISLADVFDQNIVNACVVKATESTDYTNPLFNEWCGWLVKHGKLFGFYHFAQPGNPKDQCDYFLEKTKAYRGKGIPVLDWEVDVDYRWINVFCERYHKIAGVWPVIYGNAWRFSDNVNKECERWLAAYPNVYSPSFSWAKENRVKLAPKCPGTVCMWQFCSDGHLKGYDGELDLSIFYRDKNAWKALAGITVEKDYKARLQDDRFNIVFRDSGSGKGKHTLQNSDYRITIERK